MTELETLQAINGNLVTLINLGVWGCRLLTILIGVVLFRYVTLRSPV